MMAAFAAFNRTSMELKQARSELGLLREIPFNRTSMELKPVNLT